MILNASYGFLIVAAAISELWGKITPFFGVPELMYISYIYYELQHGRGPLDESGKL